jgi:hypothetical protein
MMIPRSKNSVAPHALRCFCSTAVQNGSLYCRKNAEVELWPSQREAARRSADITDDLVVALPTSAGKTRVAEIAALMTLASERRVLIVTPLRSLSAQTERSFRRTFAPLGFSVSSLYGSSGLSSGDEDALRTREIVIATPEKLDFALRNDPTLIAGTVRKGAINSHLRLVVPTTVLETDVTPRRKTNIELRPREYLTEDEIERPRKATGAMRVANRETHADCGAQVRSVDHDALCLVFCAFER